MPADSRLPEWMRIAPNGEAPKLRTYVDVLNNGDVTKVCVFNPTISNMERALRERLFHVKVDNQFVKPLQPSVKFCTRHRDTILTLMGPCVRKSRTNIVMSYTGAKRRLYQRAHESLQTLALNKRDSYVNMFPKFEKCKSTSAPRVISPRSERFNLELGTYLKPLEKKYYKAIQEYLKSNTPVITSGLNAAEVAHSLLDAWEQFIDPVWVGVDCVKLDAHVSVQALRYEHSYYTDLFAGDEYLKRMLSWQLETKARAFLKDGCIKLRFVGRRCSGDINTSLGNKIIVNDVIIEWLADLPVRIVYRNDGDDCGFICERKDAHHLMSLDKHFAKFGFRIEREDPVDVFEKIVFCQSQPIEINGKYRMIRNLQACFDKDPLCLITIQNRKILDKWMWCVGSCGRSLAAGCPVLDAFYDVFKRHGTEANTRLLKYIFKNTSWLERTRGLDKDHTITPSARASFCMATDITPEQQERLEDYFRSLSIPPHIIREVEANVSLDFEVSRMIY